MAWRWMWEPTRQATGKKRRGSVGLRRPGVWWKDEKVSLTEGTEDGLSEEEADSWQEVTTLNHFISTSHYTPNLPPTPPSSIAFAAFFSPLLPATLFSPLFTSSSPLRLPSHGCVVESKVQVAFGALGLAPDSKHETLASGARGDVASNALNRQDSSWSFFNIKTNDLVKVFILFYIILFAVQADECCSRLILISSTLTLQMNTDLIFVCSSACLPPIFLAQLFHCSYTAHSPLWLLTSVPLRSVSVTWVWCKHNLS